MTVNIPDLSFSEWVLWHERATIPGCERGGVYRLALYRYPEAYPDMSWERVRYIGMTTDRGGLIARWRKHDRVIKRPQQDRKRWYDQGEFDPATSRFEGNENSRAGRKLFLFVSAMPVGPSDIINTDKDTEHSNPDRERTNGIIKFLEHEAFAQYMGYNQRFRRPKYNVL